MGRRFRFIGSALLGAAALMASTAIPAQAGATPSSATKPVYGGEVKVGIFDTFSGFCYGNSLANSALMSARTVYETLFEKTVGGDMIGLLATGAAPSADLKTWTVTLRQGVKFHDGTDFNAAAVVLNLQANRGMIYLAAGGAAAKAYTLGTPVSFTSNIKDVTAVDAYTVRFTLDRAQNDLPNMLYTSGRGFMRAPSQINSSSTCSTTPVGTGPFKFVSSTANQLVVAKNDSYWRTDPTTGARLPYLSKITFDNVKEGSQRAAAVRKGTYDAGMFTSVTEATFIKDLRQRRSVVTEFRSAPEYYTALWLNQAKATSPFANRDARLAVAYAFDAASFVKVRARGEGEVPNSIVGPKSIMYTTRGYVKFNLAKAKTAAAAYKASTGKDLEFTIPVDVSSSSQANGKFIQEMMSKAGIKLNLVTQETAVIIQTAFNTKTGTNDYDALSLLLLEGTDASYNLPFLVTNAFPSTSTNPAKALKPVFGALLGLSHHSDTTVDTALYAGQAAQTKAGARTAYQEATARIQSEALIVPTMRQYYSVFTTKKLHGVGKLKLEKTKTQRIVTNWGIDWTGVWKG